jgi:hypothetical protein
MSVTTLFILIYFAWGCVIAEEIAATPITTKYNMNVVARIFCTLLLILSAPIVRIVLAIELIYKQTKD